MPFADEDELFENFQSRHDVQFGTDDNCVVGYSPGDGRFYFHSGLEITSGKREGEPRLIVTANTVDDLAPRVIAAWRAMKLVDADRFTKRQRDVKPQDPEDFELSQVLKAQLEADEITGRSLYH